MNSLGAVVKAKRVVSLQVRSASVSDGLSHQWVYNTGQKIKFSIMRICSHLLKKSLMGNFSFCEVQVKSASVSDRLSHKWVLIFVNKGKITASKAPTFGCFPTDLPSMWTWYAEIAHLKGFKVLYCNPFSDKKSVYILILIHN